jgi:hypothetical protein
MDRILNLARGARRGSYAKRALFWFLFWPLLLACFAVERITDRQALARQTTNGRGSGQRRV